MSLTISRSALVVREYPLSVRIFIRWSITTSKIQAENSMRKCVSFIDWNGVANTITRGKNSLDCNIHCRTLKCFKHDLCHLLSVGLGVERGLCQKYRVIFRCNTELIVEGVVPDFLHVIPVVDDAMLNWILQCQDASLCLSFITDVGILLAHANHDTSMAWSSHNAGEDSSWCIITGKTCLG
ncbi:LOW QUALITY PROTEIN: hypothetical protein U9M48_044135 [Paspalum notatum var. saurae]|uniref:Uncharacterized protein n=1 Tax=Paspalum notatum var. saurae TaxID=547442 RepID=A0AAQ3UYM2_PASNO